MHRYLLKDPTKNETETPAQMFRRVATAICRAELGYSSRDDALRFEEEFYNTMTNLDFLPNSPMLMNAGTDVGQLAACFVLPVEDSLEGIFDSLKHMALIQQTGGGVGFSFSKLRPKGDALKSTTGETSGPVSFMNVFDCAANAIKKGGKRRAANMGILAVDHPDIMEFVRAKSNERALNTFNLSVAVTDDFMCRVKRDQCYNLVNPRTGQTVRTVRAKTVFDSIAEMAWQTGDPGLVFIDEINERNQVPHIGRIESTNPCGEQPLLPYESCTLGSINLSHMCKNGQIEWDNLSRIVDLAVRFLDDSIDVTKFPIQETERITKSNRKIGLGVMGFADMLAKMRIRYDSARAVNLVEKIMRFISSRAIEASVQLARERGPFPNFVGSTWDKMGYEGIRNATLTTIAPTGTLSIVAGCSSGIEPIFAISYWREMLDGTVVREVNPVFEQVAKDRGFYTEKLMERISQTGSVRSIKQVPRDVRMSFPTALDISPDWHLRVQAAFQRHCDNAVSKTVNLPKNATVQDVKRVFMLAYRLRCKGVAVFRYGSRKQQVLRIGAIVTPSGRGKFAVPGDYAGNCMTEYCTL